MISFEQDSRLEASTQTQETAQTHSASRTIQSTIQTTSNPKRPPLHGCLRSNIAALVSTTKTHHAPCVGLPAMPPWWSLRNAPVRQDGRSSMKGCWWRRGRRVRRASLCVCRSEWKPSQTARAGRVEGIGFKQRLCVWTASTCLVLPTSRTTRLVVSSAPNSFKLNGQLKLFLWE